MGFQYTYQKILDLKSNEKSQAEWLLSEAIGELQKEERSLQQLVRHKEEALKRLHRDSAHSLKISDIQVLQTYVDTLDMQIRQKQEQIRDAQSYVEQRQQGLADKLLDEKIWEKAKENAWIKHSEELIRKEQNVLDEMAGLRRASYIH